MKTINQKNLPFVGYDKKEIMQMRGDNLSYREKCALGRRNKAISMLKTKEGLSWSKLGERFGLSAGYVKQICHKRGVYGNR